MQDTVVIDPRFNGPATSANGGWVSGILARRLGASPVSVSLRAPPPLGVPLRVAPVADGGLALFDDQTLLAQASLAQLELAVPTAPDFDRAQTAGVLARMRAGSRGGAMSYAHCFGCGVARHDGLGIIPGPVDDEGTVAATWSPADDLAGPDGAVSVEATWAALDCPAGFAWSERLGDSGAIVTAAMTAVVDRPLAPGEAVIVLGWPIGRDGRKLHAGTAIIDRHGAVRARSRQLWMLPRA